MSMHRHTGQGSAATADPVSSATVKRRSLLPLYCENKEQNASRFGICAGFRLGARYRSLGRNDGESLGSGRNEQPWDSIRRLPLPARCHRQSMRPCRFR